MIWLFFSLSSVSAQWIVLAERSPMFGRYEDA